jgi:diaminohydroxyphosphoribosylaminopyrimidine deaminase/5-amino-6-(5-phosphoribosylamino)uracil reductase
MQMALALAEKGAGYVSPNPMVGAVVVKDDVVVGRGYHHALGGPHAEVNAIDDAGDRARGATIYVTLEPCNHHGRTPPCTRKILDAGIRRVVVAMKDPNPHVTGGGLAYLQARGVVVACGILQKESRRLNESFIKYVQTKRPFVILKMAATLDGCIATHTGDARWVTGAPARQLVHRLRHSMDAIMVGVGTVLADDPSLTTRLAADQGVDPTRIIVDSGLRIPETAQLLNQRSPADTWVVCGPDAEASKKNALRARGAHVLEVPLTSGWIDLNAMVDCLGQRGITSMLIEGGAQVAASAIREDIVDKVLFFYAPKLLGGEGVPMFAGRGPELMAHSVPLRDVEVTRVGDDILICGYRHLL